MKTIRIYDGSRYCDKCDKCDKCPVVDHLPQAGKVVIHDPHKPESGKFTMTVSEYNALIARARAIR